MFPSRLSHQCLKAPSFQSKGSGMGGTWIRSFVLVRVTNRFTGEWPNSHEMSSNTRRRRLLCGKDLMLVFKNVRCWPCEAVTRQWSEPACSWSKILLLFAPSGMSPLWHYRSFKVSSMIPLDKAIRSIWSSCSWEDHVFATVRSWRCLPQLVWDV